MRWLSWRGRASVQWTGASTALTRTVEGGQLSIPCGSLTLITGSMLGTMTSRDREWSLCDQRSRDLRHALRVQSRLHLRKDVDKASLQVRPLGGVR